MEHVHWPYIATILSCCEHDNDENDAEPNLKEYVEIDYDDMLIKDNYQTLLIFFFNRNMIWPGCIKQDRSHG